LSSDISANILDFVHSAKAETGLKHRRSEGQASNHFVCRKSGQGAPETGLRQPSRRFRQQKQGREARK
jgi:hypothetical protein